MRATAVAARESLEHPDAIVDFFSDLGCSELCFNIEEVEEDHHTSSLQGLAIEPAFRAFFDRAIDRSCNTPATMRVREIDGVLGAMRDPSFGNARGNRRTSPDES
jgi:predicted deacylase